MRKHKRVSFRHQISQKQQTRLTLKLIAAGSMLCLLVFSGIFLYSNFGVNKKAYGAVPTNDTQAGAIIITNTSNWISSNAQYTTTQATADGIRPSCWAHGPNYNVWFRFLATTGSINVSVMTGGIYGTLNYPYLAIFDSSGNVVACTKYATSTGTLQTGSTGLITGSTYYISVDNHNGNGHCGTFTLSVDNQPGNDFKIGATLLPSIINWTSSPGQYSTINGSADQNKGSCWNTGPNFNIWFKFQAISQGMTIRLHSGGSNGTLQYPYIAVWDSLNTQIACATYASATGTLELGTIGLQSGQTYYISVDNYGSPGYRGSFTLFADTSISNDFLEGATPIASISNWSSANAAYSTMDASADRIKGSCWNTGPNYNRWFTFQATTNNATIRIKTGGVYGTMQYPYLALWNQAGTQIACQKYTTATGTLELSSLGLMPGSWYFISVDNYGSAGYRGTFTLAVNDQVTYDYSEGAILLPGITNWSSANAEYTTLDGTADQSKGSCWNTGPNFNRWFKFQATTSAITVQVKSGGSYGTLQYPYIGIWNSTLAEVACQNYKSATGTLELSFNGLIAGDWYFISVDNHSSTGYRGTFTLTVNDQPTFDFKDGAVLLSNISNWSSANAAYSTLQATADQTKGSCWNTGPNNNVWFTFQSTTNFITIQLKSGGSFGTLQYPYLALWDSSGNQVACQKYITSTGTLELSFNGLSPGNKYYISVDNHASAGYKGTFTLLVDDNPSFDFPEGAVLLTDFNNWTSPNGYYTTTFGTPNGNKGSCWTNGPNNNKWFKFIAPSNSVQLDLLTGGSEGTLQYPFLALWDSTLLPLACAKYTSSGSDITINYSTLTEGKLYYYSVDNYTGYPGTFTLHLNAAPSALPIELVSFSAKMEDQVAVVSWKTASEMNNDYFSIERSESGTEFTTIGTVAGAGNSSKMLSYQFTDQNPLSSTSYYRLKQTDYDGRSETFRAVVLHGDEINHALKIHSTGPNPFSDKLDVKYDCPANSEVQIILINAAGSISYQETMKGSMGRNSIELNSISSLKSGLYFLKLIQDGQSTEPVKLIKK